MYQMRLFDKGRGVGITEAIHASAEWPVIVFFGVLTQLGDGWLLFLLGGTLYIAGDELPRWGIDRRRGLFVFALALTYAVLIELLKNVFQLPRPPGVGRPVAVELFPSILTAVLDSITTAEGHGFPSGHALGSTMVWGGTALVLNRGSTRKRLAVAGGLVALISFSRLVLGVHYLVDVVVGIGLGVLSLGFLYWLTDSGTVPGRILLVAAAVGLLGLLVDITFDSVAAGGGAIGGWLVWRWVGDAIPVQPTNRRTVFLSVLVLGVAAGLSGFLIVTKPPLVLTFLGTAVSVGVVVGAPLLAERLR